MFWYLGFDEAILAGQLSVDLKTLPAVANVSPARTPMLAKLAITILVLALSLVLYVPFAAAPVHVPIVFLPPLAALVVIATSIYGLLRKRQIRFGEHRVLVRDKRLFRTIDWTAPYLAFLGVATRQLIVAMGSHDRTFHIVEPKHPNPRLSLPLLVSDTGPPPREVLLSAARTFGLSVLDESGDDAGVNRSENDRFALFNRPMDELAQTHDLTELHDSNEPLPSELCIEWGSPNGKETLTVTMQAHRPASRWRALLIAGPIAAVAFAAFVESTVIMVEGLVFAALLAFFFANGLRRRRRLVVARRGLVHEAPWWNPGAGPRQSVALEDVEGVYINNSKSGLGHHIEIHAGEASFYAGAGLSVASLDWLRRFLLAAIAAA